MILFEIIYNWSKTFKPNVIEFSNEIGLRYFCKVLTRTSLVLNLIENKRIEHKTRTQFMFAKKKRKLYECYVISYLKWNERHFWGFFSYLFDNLSFIIHFVCVASLPFLSIEP